MTVSSTTSRMADYTGTGSVNTYAYTFRIEADADLLVVKTDTLGNDTTLTLTTDYTVTGAGDDAGGNVVLTSNLENNYKLTIRRKPAITQETDYRNQGDFLAETVEDALDKSAHIDQAQQDELDRSIKLAEINASGIDSVLPDASGKGGQFVALKSAEDGFEYVDPGSIALATPGSGTVDNTVLADMAQGTLKGRQAATGTGDPEDLSPTQAKTALGLAALDSMAAERIAGRAKGGGAGDPQALTAAQVKAILGPDGWHLDGLELSNNATDSDHDLDVAAGSCIDATKAEMITLASAITKRIDAVWAVGTNQGGLDTGTVSGNKLYAVWLIKRSDTGVVDVLFSLSFTAPTMPADYDYKRRIGAVRSDGFANIYQFTQSGHQIALHAEGVGVPEEVNDSSNGTSLESSGAVGPPKARFRGYLAILYSSAAAGASFEAYIHPGDDGASTRSTFSVRIKPDAADALDDVYKTFDVMLNSSGAFKYSWIGSGNTFKAFSLGWDDLGIMEGL